MAEEWATLDVLRGGRTALIGDEASVKEDIARFAETLGVDQFLMRTQWLGLPVAGSIRTIEALGRIFA